MLMNLTSIKSYLGKYYPELQYSSTQEKYKNTKLDTFFEQRFLIQNNKVQMIVDHGLIGLTAIVSGNEIQVSKNLYDHPNIVVSNSIENTPTTNPRNLYNPEVFSTLAYLACQNHTSFNIIGEIEEPIYIKYKSDYETFYNSVIVFNVSDNIGVEIVEEIESFSALNAVTNYILNPLARLNLTTFYQNHHTALSFCFRNIIVQANASFEHVLLGRGSANAIDENKVHIDTNGSAEFLGIVDSDGYHFHSILYVEPVSTDYKISVNYKDILSGNADVSFFPVIMSSTISNLATIEVSNITVEDIPEEVQEAEVTKYVTDIVDRVRLERMTGVERFYNNKTKFLHFP